MILLQLLNADAEVTFLLHKQQLLRLIEAVRLASFFTCANSEHMQLLLGGIRYGGGAHWVPHRSL